MADFSTYNVRDARPLGGLNDVVTIGLGPNTIGGSLAISGPFVGTITFTSDNGSGTYASQSLVSLSGAAGTTFVGLGNAGTSSASFLIPVGIVGLKATMTSFTSGVVTVSWVYSAYNNALEKDLRSARAARRLALGMDSAGVFTENFARGLCQGTAIAVSGTVYYSAMPFLAGDVITGFRRLNTVAGNTYTGAGQRYGVYLPTSAGVAGTLLTGSTTGDVNATAGLQGAVSAALTAAFIIPTDNDYYVGCIEVATTPTTALRGAAALGGGVNGSLGLAAPYGHQTGQTDLPATAALSFNSTGIHYYVGAF